MAISAVSSIGSGYLQLFRAGAADAHGRPEAASRVQPAPALAGREDADPEARLLDPDPRRPEAILAARPADEAAEKRVEAGRAEAASRAKVQSDKRAQGEANRREADSRLGELLGQKSGMERKRAERQGERSAEVLSELSQLKSRDSEVRAHEAAHVSAGGRYVTGGASYTYQKGPDGGQYAVGGEVGIDASPVSGKPEETAEKMRVVRAAALAPSEPSSADLSVAAAAAQAEAEALADIARARMDEAARKYSAGSGPKDPGAKGQAPRASLDLLI